MDIKKQYIDEEIAPALEEIADKLKEAGIPFSFIMGAENSIFHLTGYAPVSHRIFPAVRTLSENLDGENLDMDAILQQWSKDKYFGPNSSILTFAKLLGNLKPDIVTRILIDAAKATGVNLPQEEIDKGLKLAEMATKAGSKFSDINSGRGQMQRAMEKAITQALAVCGSTSHELSEWDDSAKDQFLFMQADPKQKFIDDLELEPCSEGKYNWKISLRKLFDKANELSYFV